MGKQITTNDQYCPECDQITFKKNAYGPSLAVDGYSKNRKHSSEKDFGNCARTYGRLNISSMTIDFGVLFRIYSVTVFGTTDLCKNYNYSKHPFNLLQ